MTPITYEHLQSQGFKLLIPIVSQNETQEEAVSMWAKEYDGRVIRLEHHKLGERLKAEQNGQNERSDQAPFHPEGLQVYIGEKGAIDLQYEATIFHLEELESFISIS